MSEIPPSVPPSTPPPGGSYVPPPPPPPAPGGPVPPSAGGSGDKTVMLVLSYLGILSLIPYLTAKDDPVVGWHAKNGFGLFLVEMIVVVIRIMLIFIHIPFLTCGLSIIFCFVWLGFFALSILCIVKAMGGQRFRIPVVTDFAENNL